MIKEIILYFFVIKIFVLWHCGEVESPLVVSCAQNSTLQLITKYSMNTGF